MDFVRPSTISFALFQLFLLVAGQCNEPLLSTSKLSATSTLSSDRAPTKARLNGLVAWAAGASDFSQYFVIDLGEKKNVTAIATQGKPYTSEFVQEYRIEYGDDGMDYAVVKTAQGNTQDGYNSSSSADEQDIAEIAEGIHYMVKEVKEVWNEGPKHVVNDAKTGIKHFIRAFDQLSEMNLWRS